MNHVKLWGEFGNIIPAVNIPRTWNSERISHEKIEMPTDTTSYGHNVELTWLADEALSFLEGRTKEDDQLIRKILDHTLAFGFDNKNGGIYRDGIGEKKALVFDKEWWQNFEAMTGFLNGYILFGDKKYFDAFSSTWKFVDNYFINYDVGESRQLLTSNGSPIVSDMGNSWKGIYHTGRALVECVSRLDKCIENKNLLL